MRRIYQDQTQLFLIIVIGKLILRRIMTKSQLVGVVAKKAHMTKRAAEEAIDALFDEITRTLKKGEKVVISGFGTFYVSRVKDKEVVPFGDEDKRQVIKSHRVVNFRVGKPLKREVW
jgi:DNA-binding protein HU-beta